MDCKIAGCEHKFCRVCVDLWRRESVRKAQQNTMCPNCRAPFTEVVDLGTGRAAAAAPPRPAVGRRAAAAAGFSRRHRRGGARAAAREASARGRARAAAARERAAADARRRGDARGHRVAAEDAAAVATFYATREAAQWALRAGTGKTAAEVRAEARERARAAMWGAGATPAAVQAYVEAYAAAATGAFVDAEARALAKDRDDAAAAVISAFIGEVVAATRRDAASAALAEVAEEGPKAPDPKAAAWKPFEEFADEVVEVVDAAGGALQRRGCRRPTRPSIAARWISRPSASRRCRRSRRASRASASATATTPRRRCLPPKTTSYHDPATRSSAASWRSSTKAIRLGHIEELAAGSTRITYGQNSTTRSLGFGKLLDLVRSLRGLHACARAKETARSAARRPLVRILQRPAGASPIAPPWNPHGLQADACAGARRGASRAMPGVPAVVVAGAVVGAGRCGYAPPPIPPPPHGFVPVFAPPPPVFVPGCPCFMRRRRRSGLLEPLVPGVHATGLVPPSARPPRVPTSLSLTTAGDAPGTVKKCAKTKKIKTRTPSPPPATPPRRPRAGSAAPSTGTCGATTSTRRRARTASKRHVPRHRSGSAAPSTTLTSASSTRGRPSRAAGRSLTRAGGRRPAARPAGRGASPKVKGAVPQDAGGFDRSINSDVAASTETRAL